MCQKNIRVIRYYIPTRINTDLTDYYLSSCCSEARNKIRVNPCLSVCPPKIYPCDYIPHGLTRISRIFPYHPVVAKLTTKIRVNPCLSVCQKIYIHVIIFPHGLTRISRILPDLSVAAKLATKSVSIRVNPCAKKYIYPCDYIPTRINTDSSL